MPDPACCSLTPTGGHSWRWEGCYPFISLSWHWVPVVLQTCHFILRLILILFGQLMLTKLPTLNLLQFCFERNANPTRRGTQRGTSWIGLAVPPVHHPELRLFAYHIFPWPSTLITPRIKILWFNHFFRSSFPYESHKTYVRQTCLHFVFCCWGPSPTQLQPCCGEHRLWQRNRENSWKDALHKENRCKRHCLSRNPSVWGCADPRLTKVPDANLTLDSLHRPPPKHPSTLCTSM